jgi:DNA gyrase subunit A
MALLDERSRQDFLIYANSVIKSRAIPFVEDNLKPVHRRILYTLYLDKVYADKKTKKCATEVGRVMALNPHGDAAIYGALVRLSQPWKLRYPLIDMQGSNGNLLGDSAAASRYTECKLSKVGMLMLEDIEKNAVDFKPNYDETLDEPLTLPSKFPYLLCGNNSGIAVGMSSDLVSHNFTEVSQAIKYYLDNKDCSIADLMQFIKGPDFPTKGKILNGEELLNIYTTGQGAVKVAAHYDIHKKGNKTLLVFHDVPYGIEITSGVLAPLKKLVIEDGYDVFEDFYAECTNDEKQYYDITITLAKDADVAKCLEILFHKTRLQDSIKINQTVIINKEPKLLNLKQLIEHWVNYRSNIIRRIAQTDYQKINHKLTVTIGLQKCMSDIDLLVNLIRNAENRATAKIAIKIAFELNDEQADAVLDMKLSKLSRLDLTELDDDRKTYEETLAKLKNIFENEHERYNIIKQDLDDIKKVIGEDKRLTEIHYSRPTEGLTVDKPIIKQEHLIYSDGLHLNNNGMNIVDNNLIDTVFAYSVNDIYVYNSQGELSSVVGLHEGLIGAMVKDKQNKIVTITKSGNIKVSMITEYKLTKSKEKLIKLKPDDQVVYAGFCSDEDYVMLLDDSNHVLKLAIKDLAVAGKSTLGVKSGFTTICAATIVTDSDMLLMVTKDNKGKYTAVKDFSVDNRGNKGQLVAEGTVIMRNFPAGRDSIYVIPKTGRTQLINRDKISIKGRTAIGASVTTRAVNQII